ncbi:MAG: beta-lactamase family protein [Planctomycetes bacterium]|nr:beta-lactamase family protein [Planctomycetota bacterium]MCB9918556.1 beta-lactamase family protein [Planctomycetota bacterium]
MHTISRIQAALVALAAATSAGLAQAPICYDFAAVDQELTRLVRRPALTGASMALVKDGRTLYRKSFGTYSGHEVVPLASASKWIAGMLVMSQVDDGKITLDDTLAKWFGPSLPGNMGRATIRQCMSHTAGFDGKHDAVDDRTLTLKVAVERILATPIPYDPGTTFYYGGVSMHVVGRILELASGRDLEVLLTERLLKPMGITSIDFQGLGPTKNYRIAGGMRTNLTDYTKLLVMLTHDGMYGTTRVLSEAAIREMFVDQTNGATIVHTPHPDSRRYGIGIWRDRIDTRGDILQASSQGAFGFSPWIDFERDLVGVFVVVNLVNLVYDDVDAIQRETRDIVDYAGVLCVGRGSTSCLGTVSSTANNAATRGASLFALQSTGAPPSTAGVLVLSATGLDQGVPFLGGELWVGLIPAILITAVTDGTGSSTIPLPLTTTPIGTHVFAQFVWLETHTCGALGQLDTSPALEIRVR